MDLTGQRIQTKNVGVSRKFRIERSSEEVPRIDLKGSGLNEEGKYIDNFVDVLRRNTVGVTHKFSITNMVYIF